MNEFLWPIRIYYEDTDSGGVVYYANYLKFMERTRTEWLRSLGYDQDELACNDGVIFAVRKAELDFLGPARFNELLKVSVRVIDLGKASITFEQQVLRDQEPQVTLCSGQIRIACLDAATLRPRPIPQRLFAELSSDQ